MLETILNSWPDWQLGFTAPPQLLGPLAGGLTNRSYLLAANHRRWVLRLNADNGAELGIDRGVEQRILEATAAVGLAPRRYHCDPARGLLVTEYLPIWRPREIDAAALATLAARMRLLHRLAVRGVPVVNYLEYTESYVARLRAGGRWGADLAALRERELPALERFQRDGTRLSVATEALCHHDPSPAHWRLRGDGPCLIDWEYAAVRDPACDLALLMESWQLSAAQMTELLSCYGGSVDLERITQAQRLCRYVNRLWFALQKISTE